MALCLAALQSCKSFLTSVEKSLEDRDGSWNLSSRGIQGTQKLGLPGLPRIVSTLRNTWGIRTPLPSRMQWGKSRTPSTVVPQLCDLRCHLPSLGFSFLNIEVQGFTSPFSEKEFIPTQSSSGAVHAGNMSCLPALESGDSD